MGAVVNMGLLETPNLLCEGAASAKNDTIALKPNRAVVLTSFRAGMRIVIRTDKEQNAYGATQEDSLSRATPGLAFWPSADCKRPNGNQPRDGIRTSAGAVFYSTFSRQLKSLTYWLSEYQYQYEYQHATATKKHFKTSR